MQSVDRGLEFHDAGLSETCSFVKLQP
jgi:hypothetical protein